jgi:hypothetical protein
VARALNVWGNLDRRGRLIQLRPNDWFGLLLECWAFKNVFAQVGDQNARKELDQLLERRLKKHGKLKVKIGRARLTKPHDSGVLISR